MNVLKTDKLSKQYRGQYVLNEASLTIEQGDIYGFVGENGAGKTTLMRIISGLGSPTSGDYYLFDVLNTSNDIYQVRSKVSAIIETPYLNKGLNAIENLRLQAIITDTKFDLDYAKELMSKVGLDYDQLLKRKVGHYSLGMKQRLAIAIALLNKPSFIILDEPMNGLDPQGFREIRELILSLNSQGITFFISSHILSELEKICNKVCFISHGKILKEVLVDDIRNATQRKIEIALCDSSRNLEVIEKLRKDLNLNNAVIQEDKILIFDDIENSVVLKTLLSYEIDFKHANVIEGNIEDYYLDLIDNQKKGNL